MVELPIAKAITAGLREAMRKDDKVLMFGEDVAQLGGVFRVTEGLLDEFGKNRIFDSPIAESGIIGTAIGLAMRGYRPVTEIQFDGFIFPAFDQITSQLARLQNRSEGFTKMPVVIRVPYGGGIGAVEHHSESPEAYFAHTPGLRLISPSTPNDAYWRLPHSAPKRARASRLSTFARCHQSISQPSLIRSRKPAAWLSHTKQALSFLSHLRSQLELPNLRSIT